jgi:ADP-heptose:LPS heptosyltransferase
MQNINGDFIKALTGKKIKFIPIKYNINPKENLLTQQLAAKYANNDIVGLCCVSKEHAKDMPIETAVQLIKKLNENNKTVFLFGAGHPSKEYAENLEKFDDIKFVNLVNSTSIYDMANIMSICKGFISVDTGTMHLSYAVQCPTVCLFYKDENITKWAPNTYLYNVSVIDKDFSVANIYNKLLQITDKI